MIGIRLKKIRTHKGLSQTELGEKAGVSHIQIGRYENGKTIPSSKVIKKLAEALEVETEYFFQGMESENVELKEIDHVYKKVRDLVSDDVSEMVTLKKLLEAIAFSNAARRQFIKS